MKVKYTTINHEARERLGLTWHEYGLADLIYHLGNNPQSPYRGWCYATKEFLATQLGVSRRAITDMVAKIIDKGLVEKHPETKHLRITVDWYQEVMIKDSREEETSHSEKKLPPRKEETSHPVEKKVPITCIPDKEKDKEITEAKASVTKRFFNPGMASIGSILKDLEQEPDEPVPEPKFNRITHDWQAEAIRLWKMVGLRGSPSAQFFKLIKLTYQKGKQARLPMVASYCKDASGIRDKERLFYWRFYNNPAFAGKESR
ncbi:MAG: MarR family transcriptional regulator [Patescibacteria group bacterium]|nr:MarR family transcriptional regulator [Patescibacteria group bacterium]